MKAKFCLTFVLALFLFAANSKGDPLHLSPADISRLEQHNASDAPAALVKTGSGTLTLTNSSSKIGTKPNATKPDAKLLPWLTNLAEGRRRATADRKPLLVRISAAWSAPSRKLDVAIEMPSVQAELARWTLVSLDADKDEEKIDDFEVKSLPALRIRAILGEAVAAHDGAFTAEELVAWLKKQFDAASAEADDVLLSDAEPGAVDVIRLIKQFKQRNPALREAAIRRLSPYPQKACQEVARVFVEGALSDRLAALELLRAWQAPFADLDPWHPESLAKDRLTALTAWADKFQAEAVANVAKSPAAGDKTLAAKILSEQELVDARHEIDRMLKAGNVDAEAIRQRLAGYGPGLLGEVAARQKAATTDEQRERLWALRYRLVACDALILRWPGGLERLAATDPRRRQQAADELATLASAADQPLLVELFSDADPLVREFSLRGLQNIGGKKAAGALVRLLSDPDPNVRAAILKQFEEKPDAEVVPKLADYLKTEKDPDLLVHAIRFLKVAGGAAATKAMIPLLHHDSWQVRAEACEALGKANSGRNRTYYVNGNAVPSEGEALQAEVYVALLDVLDDADAFVVSRAVEGLANADMELAVDPLARAATKHPDLAPQIVDILAKGEKSRVAALPKLKKFRTDANPKVRAAALAGIVDAAPIEIGAQLSDGLNDSSDVVRIAAADLLFKTAESERSRMQQQLNQKRSSGEPDPFIDEVPKSALGAIFDVFVPSNASAKPAAKADGASDDKAKSAPLNPYDAWLTQYCSGMTRPKWMSEMISPLDKMMQSKDAGERLASAKALVALGKADTALPVLYAIAQGDAKQFHAVLPVLAWLDWDHRLPFFRQLQKAAKMPATMTALLSALGQTQDPRANDVLWERLADPNVSLEQGASIKQSLIYANGITNWYSLSTNQPSQGDANAKRILAGQAKPKTAAGSDVQRLVALALMPSVDLDDAIQTAVKMQTDSTASPALKLDAFQVALAISPRKDAETMAARALSGKDVARQKLALQYLVHGAASMRELRGRIDFPIVYENDYSSRSGTPIVPKPPQGVEAGQLLPLLNDPNPTVAAEVGYLLCLLGESQGLAPLLRYYEEHKSDDDGLKRLVYRAVAALDDSSQVPLLRKIYASYEPNQLSDFYWTIRIMTGPEILKLRKQIRDEVGVQQLQ